MSRICPLQFVNHIKCWPLLNDTRRARTLLSFLILSFSARQRLKANPRLTLILVQALSNWCFTSLYSIYFFSALSNILVAFS